MYLTVNSALPFSVLYFSKLLATLTLASIDLLAFSKRIIKKNQWSRFQHLPTCENIRAKHLYSAERFVLLLPFHFSLLCDVFVLGQWQQIHCWWFFFLFSLILKWKFDTKCCPLWFEADWLEIFFQHNEIGIWRVFLPCPVILECHWAVLSCLVCWFGFKVCESDNHSEYLLITSIWDY